MRKTICGNQIQITKQPVFRITKAEARQYTKKIGNYNSIKKAIANKAFERGYQKYLKEIYKLK